MLLCMSQRHGWTRRRYLSLRRVHIVVMDMRSCRMWRSLCLTQVRLILCRSGATVECGDGASVSLSLTVQFRSTVHSLPWNRWIPTVFSTLFVHLYHLFFSFPLIDSSSSPVKPSFSLILRHQIRRVSSSSSTHPWCSCSFSGLFSKAWCKDVNRLWRGWSGLQGLGDF